MMKKLWFMIVLLVVLNMSLFCFAEEKPAVSILPTKIPTTSFSFASDTYHQGPTFTGYQNYIKSGAEVDLKVDLNNDTYGGTVTFLANLELKAEIYDHRVYYIGSQWLHVWKVYAEITFIHTNRLTQKPLLTIAFKEGVLTSWSPNNDTIGETMTLQNCESADPSIYMKPQSLLNGIGVSSTYLSTSEDIAFTFTNIRPVNSESGPLVGITKSGTFSREWVSEGSFSASAYPALNSIIL